MVLWLLPTWRFSWQRCSEANDEISDLILAIFEYFEDGRKWEVHSYLKISELKNNLFTRSKWRKRSAVPWELFHRPRCRRGGARLQKTFSHFPRYFESTLSLQYAWRITWHAKPFFLLFLVHFCWMQFMLAPFLAQFSYDYRARYFTILP